jgi:putative transposase
MITAGTYQTRHHFRSPERLNLLHGALLDTAAEFRWSLQAWAVLANHYHFVATSVEDGKSLRRLLSKLHMITADQVNPLDSTPGRQVWFQFWDTQLTYQRSYLARLKYVIDNPVHHGIVRDAREYPWCSAAWFERVASPAFFKTVSGLKTARLRIEDDF